MWYVKKKSPCSQGFQLFLCRISCIFVWTTSLKRYKWEYSTPTHLLLITIKTKAGHDHDYKAERYWYWMIERKQKTSTVPPLVCVFQVFLLPFFTCFADSVWILLTNTELLPSAPCILMKTMGRISIIALPIYALLTARSYPSHEKKKMINK